MIVMKKLVWYGRVSMPFYTKKKSYLLNLAERSDLKLSTMFGKDKNVQKNYDAFFHFNRFDAQIKGTFFCKTK